MGTFGQTAGAMFADDGGFTEIPNCPSCGQPDAGCAGSPSCPCVIPSPSMNGGLVLAGWWAVVTVEADNLPANDIENFRRFILDGGVYLDPDTRIPVFDLNIDWQPDDCTGSGDVCFGLNEEIAETIANLEAEGYTIIDAGLRCGPSSGPFGSGSGPGGCPVGEFYSIRDERCFPLIAPFVFTTGNGNGNGGGNGNNPPPPPNPCSPSNPISCSKPYLVASTGCSCVCPCQVNKVVV
jgi:hypothetical protein